MSLILQEGSQRARLEVKKEEERCNDDNEKWFLKEVILLKISKK
jgi:hypothetical protein